MLARSTPPPRALTPSPPAAQVLVKKATTLQVYYTALVDELSGENFIDPVEKAIKTAVRFSGVCRRTVFYWKKEFETHDLHFVESPNGKYARFSVLQNEAHHLEICEFLRLKIHERPTQAAKKKAEAGAAGDGAECTKVFTITSFKDWLNECFFRKHKIFAPYHTEADREMKKYMTVCYTTALVLAHKCGLSYNTHKKSYYVDRHDAPDVLEHCFKWVQREQDLGFRSYEWFQVTLAEAKKLNFDSDGEFDMLGLDEIENPFYAHIRGELVHHYKLDDVEWVELHVDIFSRDQRAQLAEEGLFNLEVIAADGVKCVYDMGGKLSVRMPAGAVPIVKCGQDETIFKQWAMHSKEWNMEGKRRARPKNEGKGIMYSEVNNCIHGAGFLHLPEARWAAFQTWRRLPAQVLREMTTHHENPALVQHKYGKNEKGGYWDADDVVKQMAELLDLCDFLYPAHAILLNVDWSSNHAARSKTALHVDNMNLSWGGKRQTSTTDKTKVPLPTIEVTFEKDDLGPFNPTVEVGKPYKLAFGDGDGFFQGGPSYTKTGDVAYTKADGYDGEPVGKKELLIRTGWWRPGMTVNGSTASKVQADVSAPSFKRHDIVIIDGTRLGRVTKVPADAGLMTGMGVIEVRKMPSCTPVTGKHKGTTVFSTLETLSPESNTTESIVANRLERIPMSLLVVCDGKASNKRKFTIANFDVEQYVKSGTMPRRGRRSQGLAAAPVAAGADPDKDARAALDRELGRGVDPTSVNSVLQNLPCYKKVKSMLHELVEKRGHLLELSSKYHAECAGDGVEYIFGKCKYWYRSHHRHSTDGLVNDSLASFDPDVLPMSFIRACSSRSRRYMRVYRFSLKDGAGRGTSDKTEEYVKTLRKCRSHRSALDSHTTFCRDGLIAPIR